MGTVVGIAFLALGTLGHIHVGTLSFVGLQGDQRTGVA